MRRWVAILRVQARYWQRHRVQALLCLAGTVVGVAVYCAIRLANEGALAAFAQGVDAYAGRATHRVFAPDGTGVPERLFPLLSQAPGVLAASPLLEDTLRMKAPGAAPGQSVSVTALGLDPLTDEQFRAFRFVSDSGSTPEDPAQRGAVPPSAPGAPGPVQPKAHGARNATPQETQQAQESPLERFLRIPGAMLVPAPLARELGLGVGSTLRAQADGRVRTFTVAGVYALRGDQAALFAHTVILDIASQQEAFGKLRRLDAIRLVLAPGAESAVRGLLPPGVSLERTGQQAERVARMSRAFRLNLEALGLFALLVAAFLIFSTASFSVAQRQGALAVLRCVGASRGSLFAALAGESILLGLAGGALGVLAGRWLANAMVLSTSATLFEVLLERSAPPATVQLTPGLWLAGLALGVAVSWLGTLLPAWEAARVSPLASLRGSRLVDQRGARLALWSLAALPCLALAAALLLSSHGSLPGGLIGATALALGGALLCPAAVWLLGAATTGALQRLLGVVGLLAGRNLASSTSRVGLAAASLMVALALALAIQITVRSFRQTFLLWLNQAITADLYLSPATPGRDARFPQQLAPELRRQPFVREYAELNLRRVLLQGREVLVAGIDVDTFARTSSLPMVEGDPARAMSQVRQGAALISETLAYPLGLHAGDEMALPTAQGPRPVKVAGVVQNYSVPQGIVYVDQATFTRLLGPQVPREAAIWLAPGTSVEQAQQALERLPGAHLIKVTPNRLLRREALRVFDRTFAITGLMGGLATLVAFIAMLSGLTALLQERQRVQGYLRAMGVSRRVLGAALALEAALLAVAAAVMSWGVGLLMAAVLVFVINKRAFGWSLQFLPGSGSYLALLGLALAAALLGTLYPLYRGTRGSFLATIREE